MAFGTKAELAMAGLLDENALLQGQNFDVLRADPKAYDTYLGILAIGIQEINPDVILPLVPFSSETGPALDLTALQERRMLGSCAIVHVVMRGLSYGPAGTFSYDFFDRESKKKYADSVRPLVVESVRESDNKIVALFETLDKAQYDLVNGKIIYKPVSVLTVVDKSINNSSETASGLKTARHETIIDLTRNKTVREYMTERQQPAGKNNDLRVPKQHRQSAYSQRIKLPRLGRSRLQ